MPAPPTSRRRRSRDTVGSGARHRALHRRGRLRRPGRPRPAGARVPDLDLFHPWDLPVDEAIELARALRGRGLRGRSARSPTPKGRGVSTQQSSSSRPTASASPAAIRRSRHYISCAVDRRARAARCSATTGTPRRATPRDLAAARRSGATPAQRAAGAPAAPQAEDDARCRCCSRRRWPAACSATSSARSAAAACTASPRSCSTAWASRCSRRRSQISEQPHLPERARAAAPFDDDGVATHAARRGEGRRAAGLFPRHLLGAQARHADAPATPAAATT